MPGSLLDCEVKSNPIRVFSAVKQEVQFKVAAGVRKAINQLDALEGLANWNHITDKHDSYNSKCIMLFAL